MFPTGTGGWGRVWVCCLGGAGCIPLSGSGVGSGVSEQQQSAGVAVALVCWEALEPSSTVGLQQCSVHGCQQCVGQLPGQHTLHRQSKAWQLNSSGLVIEP